MSAPTFGVPYQSNPLVNKDGAITSEWYRLLVRLAQLSAERPMGPVSVGVSPFTFLATTIGSLLISGGNVSAVSLVRGGVAIASPTSGFVPMAAGDTVTVTYSVLPAITFVPAARA